MHPLTLIAIGITHHRRGAAPPVWADWDAALLAQMANVQHVRESRA